MKKSLEIFFFIGRLFSPLYSLAMRFRSFLYVSNIFAQEQLPVPVVSVGNLTMGGTGKTPMVLYIAEVLAGSRKTVILSRGYGGKAKGAVNIVSDGERLLLSAQEAGDEPRFLAESLPGVAVLTGAKRVESGCYAVEKMAAELVIMDDGFQHMALKRDCNLVLWSAGELLGNGWVFPGGVLREPFSALKRADAFVITGGMGCMQRRQRDFVEMLSRKFPEKPIFLGEYRPTGLKRAADDESVATNNYFGVPLLAFCGIAKPASFKSTLLEEGLTIEALVSYSDHHEFTNKDLGDIERRAREAGCEALVTTAKDFVKLQSLSFHMPLLVLNVELVMENGFRDFLIAKLFTKE